MSRAPSVRSLTPAFVAAMVCTAAWLRASGLKSELWFDEICSIVHVRSTPSLWAALWSIHTDNKHHLIWLWIWLCERATRGAIIADWVFRLPSWLAGVIVLPLIFLQVRREWDTRTAWITLIFSAYCYPLIFYASEARGYSLVVLFAVLAYSLAPDHRANPSRVDSSLRALSFGLVIVLGFLSHLTFVYIYAGLLAWAAVEAIHKPRWILLVYHLPAFILLLLIYWFDISQLQYGGGTPKSGIEVLRNTISMTFGSMTDGNIGVVLGLAILLLTGIGLRSVYQHLGLGRTLFFIIAIFVTPIALTITRHNPYLAVRYYLVLFPFVLLLMSVGLATYFRSLIGKIVTTVLLAMCIWNSCLGSLQLQALGRGHVRECLQQMASHSSPGNGASNITYGSERPVMDRFNIDYYAARLSPPQNFVEIDQSPQWWILDLDTPFAFGPPLISRSGAVYKLDSVYPSDPTSGLTWDLYRKQP